MWPFSQKCQHDDEILTTVELKSAHEQMAASGHVMSHSEGFTARQLFGKKTVIVFKCKICKRILESEHVNP